MKMVVEEGKSIFFTGSAGTGKSLLLKAIISALKKKHASTPEVVSVTASTGMAASNIGGMTLHSWGAIAPSVDDLDRLLSYIRTARPALLRWKRTQILIIDEVSMVDGHLFEKICSIAARLRKKTDRPFGGIQVSPAVVGARLSAVDDALRSLSSLVTSFSYPLSPKMENRLSLHSNAMHGKRASSRLLH
ncbi:PIF1-like helicase-domain-containing protein [Russula brevipes]|nr:PIF1-like helicase-domain-containing protein [Russula brevipes]